MSPDTAVSALRKFRAELSQAKQLDVLRAIQDLADDPRELTIAGVSRAAKVSREFIHSHPHLHRAVQEAAQLSRLASASSVPSELGGSTQGLRADRATLLDRVEIQRAQIMEQQERLKKFEEQRRLWLGSQLPTAETIDPEVHAELHLTSERLMSEKGALTRKVSELRQLLDVARADLAASREGWTQDIARFTQKDPQVVSFDRARSKQT